MATPYPRIWREKKLPEVIISSQNIQPKFKAQAGFVRNGVVLFPILCLYHDEVMKYDLME